MGTQTTSPAPEEGGKRARGEEAERRRSNTRSAQQRGTVGGEERTRARGARGETSLRASERRRKEMEACFVDDIIKELASYRLAVRERMQQSGS